MQITYHGHSCVQIVTKGKSLLIDPFLRGNPIAVTKPEDIQTDYILLTHAHTDHILDAEPIARANDATVVATFELAMYMSSRKQLKTIDMNIGGTVDLGFAKAKMIQAFHSSGIFLEEGQIIYGGMPAGYIIQAEGLTILHAGDTALFSDMKMIGDRHPIDIAFLPIGDHYTMGPDDALQAAEWFGAKLVIPVHYNSFPLIRQNAQDFVRRLEVQGQQGRVLAPGEKFEITKEK
ncbi:metal-dependent hydrolase [Cohnella mopanensis]|uniref:metal-dependent hydrolase n=1 Tax=Cohnella mopanensis TaxID=2911966 RepID=UPI001EF81E18|nr:metal-dependent hydrolase [Cohnella mopanensis]